MNYLAHVFLSGADPEIIVGNFIADAVRGKQVLEFPAGIQKGILLHRAIDHFTDFHAVVAETKNRLRPTYGKYASVIADMYYDHFLAAHFSEFSKEPLSTFTSQIYTVLQKHWNVLPERVKSFLPHMMQHNWMLGYAQLAGIERALTGLSRRATFNSGMETAAGELKQHYTLYEAEFRVFMPQLIAFSQQWLADHSNQNPVSGV